MAAHKGTIGNPPGGPGPPPGIFGLGQNLCKTSPWEGLGGKMLHPIWRFPGYHRNHSPRKKSRETSWGTNPSTKLCFSAPLFGPQKGPRAFLGQDVGPGLQKLVLGSKISKLRIEKPCRIHRSLPQTEPCVASCEVVGKSVWGGRDAKI